MSDSNAKFCGCADCRATPEHPQQCAFGAFMDRFDQYASDITARRENADHRDNYIRQLEQQCATLEGKLAALSAEKDTWKARAYALGGPLP